METRLTGIDQIRHFMSFNNIKRPERKLSINSQITNEFMQRFTTFWSVEEMQDEFEQQYGVELTNIMLDSEIFNRFINEHSIFKRWRDLLNKASDVNMNKLVRKAMAY